MPGKKEGPDLLLLTTLASLLGLGLIMVFSSSSYAALITYDDPAYYFKRQLVWLLLGLAGMYFTYRLQPRVWQRLANPALLTSLVCLALVLLIGRVSHGSSRWLNWGGLNFQPSELIKLTMVIFLAKNLAENQARMHNFVRGVLPYLAILGLVAGLILAQPDLGTAVAVAGTSFLLLVVAGSRLDQMGLLALTGVGAVGAAIYLEPYRMKRFMAFLDPFADPMGSGFQTIQSLLALGSGRLFGVGLGQGRQKMLYVPERHTDFIFAIIGEELGFIGAALLILLFLLLAWRGIKIALDQPNAFYALLATGITTMLVLQAIINIGVVTGSLPVTGITLPLVSYGGSSLVFSLAGLGILLRLSNSNVAGHWPVRSDSGRKYHA